MNRLVLAALALVAVGGGTYYYVMTRPSVGPGDGVTPLPARAANEPTAAPNVPAELVDPKAAPAARTELERPSRDSIAGAPQSEMPSGQQPQVDTAPYSGPPAIPASMPPIPEADEAAMLDKYGNATPDERRQALDSLTSTYKEAAMGLLKNSEQLMKELESEMQWLEAHIDL